jgi:hypothetical protein
MVSIVFLGLCNGGRLVGPPDREHGSQRIQGGFGRRPTRNSSSSLVSSSSSSSSSVANLPLPSPPPSPIPLPPPPTRACSSWLLPTPAAPYRPEPPRRIPLGFALARGGGSILPPHRATGICWYVDRWVSRPSASTFLFVVGPILLLLLTLNYLHRLVVRTR